MEKIREQAILLGPRKSLVGVISPAVASATDPDAPMVVILNSGIIHRVGANRASVSLARELAVAGFPAIRFDLSGLGDSENRIDALPPLKAGMADIRDALDTIQSARQIRRFILMGLCSGADYSISYAGTDSRVVGVVLLDPSIPRTFRYYLQHYAARILKPAAWRNFVRGHALRYLERKGDAADGIQSSKAAVKTLNTPEARVYLEGVYRNALQRGNQIMAIFTAGLEGQHNYRKQLLDVFPSLTFGKQLQLHYFADSDHTFTAESHRRQLIQEVVGWVRSTQFAPGSQDQPAPH